MCRSVTRAVRDVAREEVLRERYPGRWAERDREERGEVDEVDGEGEVKAMTVFVGNKHRLLEGRTGNCHEWTFFVRPGDVEVVEEVQIMLVGGFWFFCFVYSIVFLFPSWFSVHPPRRTLLPPPSALSLVEA